MDQNTETHVEEIDMGSQPDAKRASAVGIGSLMEDGLGDTIRVSLTEEPDPDIVRIPIIYESTVIVNFI